MGARLGQHFLKNPQVARALVEAARITASDTVLEIGPGGGALTRELLASGAHVIAVEKDPQLAAALRKNAPKNLQIIEGDIRDVSPDSLGLGEREYIVAANIPYYITGEILRQCLSAQHQPKHMALLVQKEVAERIIARDGKESILSLSVKVFGNPRIVRAVSRGNFNPPPSVDSAILAIDSISRANLENTDETLFFSLVRAGFSSKRKLLVRNLEKVLNGRAREACATCAIPENARAEDVPLARWLCLVRAATH